MLSAFIHEVFAPKMCSVLGGICPVPPTMSCRVEIEKRAAVERERRRQACGASEEGRVKLQNKHVALACHVRWARLFCHGPYNSSASLGIERHGLTSKVKRRP